MSSWRDAARTWQKRTGGCKRRFRSLELSNFHHSSTCKWPHQPPSPCAHHVSVLQPPPPHHPPLMPGPIPISVLPVIGPSPWTHGLRLLQSHVDQHRLMPSVLDRNYNTKPQASRSLDSSLSSLIWEER